MVAWQRAPTSRSLSRLRLAWWPVVRLRRIVERGQRGRESGLDGGEVDLLVRAVAQGGHGDDLTQDEVRPTGRPRGRQRRRRSRVRPRGRTAHRGISLVVGTRMSPPTASLTVAGGPDLGRKLLDRQGLGAVLGLQHDADLVRSGDRAGAPVRVATPSPVLLVVPPARLAGVVLEPVTGSGHDLVSQGECLVLPGGSDRSGRLRRLRSSPAAWWPLTTLAPWRAARLSSRRTPLSSVSNVVAQVWIGGDPDPG